MDREDNNEDKFSIFWTVTIATITCIILWIGGMYLTQWYANKYFEVISSEGNKFALLLR